MIASETEEEERIKEGPQVPGHGEKDNNMKYKREVGDMR